MASNPDDTAEAARILRTHLREKFGLGHYGSLALAEELMNAIGQRFELVNPARLEDLRPKTELELEGTIHIPFAASAMMKQTACYPARWRDSLVTIMAAERVPGEWVPAFIVCTDAMAEQMVMVDKAAAIELDKNIS